jgi:hypothetical protein
LKRELDLFAAWLPVTNTFEVGDYGMISGGVFVKMGNVQTEFGVPLTIQPGQHSSLMFSSAGVSMSRLVGSVAVQALPNTTASAKIVLAFQDQQEFLVRAASLRSEQLGNMAAVAAQLARDPAWLRRYRVVSAVYHGEDCSVVSSSAANARIELSGDAQALKAFETTGNASVGVTASDAQKIGVQVLGKSGPIALSLFKLGWFGPVPQTLSASEFVSHDNQVVKIVEHTKWEQADDDV